MKTATTHALVPLVSLVPTDDTAPPAIPHPSDDRVPVLIARAGDKALLSFVNFFAGEIEIEKIRF